MGKALVCILLISVVNSSIENNSKFPTRIVRADEIKYINKTEEISIVEGGYVITSLCPEIQNKSTFQDFYWRNYFPGSLPPDAYKGHSGLYIGQAYEEGSVPGSIYPYNKMLIVEKNGRRIHKVDTKIFCTKHPEKFYWQIIDVSKPFQVTNAVPGGYDHKIRSPLYIGKTYHEKEWKIGQVILSSRYKGLRVWKSNGKYCRLTLFQLLKYNNTPEGHTDDDYCMDCC